MRGYLKHTYLIALGSNQRHARFGRPDAVLAAALKRLDRKRERLVAASRVIQSAPLGPSLRRYANAAAVVTSSRGPEKMLRRLHRIEAKFGRIRRGQRWGARVLDLDLVLWSGGAFVTPGLTIPHPEFRKRSFVLGPAREVAARWRDPLTGLTVRHLAARLTRPRPLPRGTVALGALSSVGRATDF